MNTSTDVCGSVEYTKTIPVQGNVEIHAIWTIPDFENLLNNLEIGEIKTQVPPAEWMFQLRMRFVRPGFSDVYISFFSPKLVFIKSAEMRCCIFNVKTWVYEDDDLLNSITGTIVEARTWHQIDKLSNRGSYLQDGHGYHGGVNKILNMMRNGSLRFKFKFVVTINEFEESQFQIPASRLTTDFENLFLDGLYTDAVMKSANGEEFRVHKAVLANRCVVLKDRFEHNMTESNTNIVKTPHESAVLCEVLRFIYTDKTPKVNEIPEELLAAADYYQLSRLKSLCEEALYEKLTLDNAIETLTLADLYSANTLQQLTLEFIKDRRQSLITETESRTKLLCGSDEKNF